MTIEEALKIEQNWTVEQARNDIERYLLRDEPPAYKAVALAIVALEKQIPKKPVLHKSIDFLGKCPVCKQELCIDDEQLHFCPKCGQALGWGSEDVKQST